MITEDNNIIRSIVRGSYDIQSLRISIGNRVTANFKSKLGFKADGEMSEADLEKESKNILTTLRAAYLRITDGIVNNGDDYDSDKVPSIKKFKGNEIISTFAELTLVNSYIKLLRDEEQQFKLLESAMKGIPIYDIFLSTVDGIGPQMAGIIISEIDIRRSEYPSSLWALAGLDVVTVGKYTDASGKERIVPAWKIDAFYEVNDSTVTFLAEGKYPVTFEQQGRSRREGSLVEREYTTRAGETSKRISITFNPFLKTKLIGVLASAFLRSGKTFVNGERLGAAKRLKMAQDLGYKATDDSDVNTFLRATGHMVEEQRSEYGAIYYAYKNRLQNDSRHSDKTDLHKHNMALRYMVKRFLVTLYQKWRAIEGLPIAEEYSVKLGLTHGISTFEKQRFYENQRKAA